MEVKHDEVINSKEGMEFGWENFKNGKFGIQCYDGSITELFLQQCEKRKFTWHYGEVINPKDTSDDYIYETKLGKTEYIYYINNDEADIKQFGNKLFGKCDGLVIGQSENSNIPLLSIKNSNTTITLTPNLEKMI